MDKHLPDSTNTIPDSTRTVSHAVEILCDTVYEHKGYKLSLLNFDPANEDETKANTIFIVYKLVRGNYMPIFSDSVYNTLPEIQFEDYNNDNIKDILIQNYADVRSNLTYYLYMVDTANDQFKKVQGFEEIKNPSYNPKYNLIDNYVVSGRNWTSFYRIQADTVKDYNIVIYDDLGEQGDVYQSRYNSAVKRILNNKNTKGLKKQ